MAEILVDRLVIQAEFDVSQIDAGIQSARENIQRLADLFSETSFGITLERVNFEAAVDAARRGASDIRREFDLLAQSLLRDLETALVGGDLGIDGQKAGTAIGRGVIDGFRGQIDDLVVLLAQGMPPAEFAARVRQINTAMAEEFARLKASVHENRIEPGDILPEDNEMAAQVEQVRGHIARLRQEFQNPGRLSLSVDRALLEQSVDAAKQATQLIRREFELTGQEMQQDLQRAMEQVNLSEAAQKKGQAAGDAIRQTMSKALDELNVALAKGMPIEVYAQQAKQIKERMAAEFQDLQAQLERHVIKLKVEADTALIQKQIKQMTLDFTNSLTGLQKQVNDALQFGPGPQLKFDLPEEELARVKQEANTMFDEALKDMRDITALAKAGDLTPQVATEQLAAKLKVVEDRYLSLLETFKRAKVVPDTKGIEEAAKAAEEATQRLARNKAQFDQLFAPKPRTAATAKAKNDLEALTLTLKRLQNDERAGTISTNELAIAISNLRQEALALKASGVVDTAQEMNELNRILDATSPKARELGVAFRHARLGAAQMAASMLGASGAAANMANGLLVFAGGSALAVGVAVGILSIVAVMKVLRVEEDLLKEDMKELSDGMVSGAAAFTRASNQLKLQADATKVLRDELQETIDKRQEFLDSLERQENFVHFQALALLDRYTLGLLEGFFLVKNRHEMEKLTNKEIEQRIKLHQAEAQEIQAQVDGWETVRQQQRELVNTTIQLRNVGLQVGPRTGLNESLRENLALTQDITKSDKERLEALTTAQDIVEEMNRPFREQAELIEKNAQRQIQNFQRLQQQSQDFTQPLGVEIDLQGSAVDLQKIGDELRANAEEARRRAATLGDMFKQERDGLLASAQEWENLVQTIDDLMSRRQKDVIDNALKDMDRLIERINKASETGQVVEIPVSIDDTEAVKNLTEVEKFLQDMVAGFEAAQQAAPAALLDKLKEVQDKLAAAINAPINAVIATVDVARQELANLQMQAQFAARLRQEETGVPDTIARQAELLDALQPQIQQLREGYARITDELEEGNLTLARRNQLVAEQLDIQRQLKELEAPTPLEVTQLEPLQRATAELVQARLRLQVALRGTSQEAVDQAQNEVEAAERNVRRIAEAISDTLSRLGLPAGLLKKIMEQVEKALKDAGIEATGLLKKFQEMVKLSQQMVSGFNTLTGVLRDMEALSDEGERFLGFMTQAGAQFASGDVFGGIMSGLSGVGTLLSGLFGPNEEEIAAKNLQDHLDANTSALERATIAYERSIEGVGNLLRIGDDLRAVEAAIDRFHELGAGGTRISEATVDVDTFRRFLEPLGVAFEEIMALAESLDIELIDKNGRVVVDALDQLGIAIDDNVERMTHFGTSLQEQTDALELGARLRGDDLGLDSAQQARAAFERQLDALEEFSPAIAAMFQDLGNEDAVRNALVDLWEQMASKAGIDPELLGTLTQEEFTKFLNQGADYLDSFNEAVKDATKSTFNLPVGFKNLAFAFEASAPGPPPTTPPINLGDAWTPPDGVMKVKDDSLDELLEVMKVATQEPKQLIEQLTLEINGSDDPREVARQVLAVLRELGLSQSGDTMQGVQLT